MESELTLKEPSIRQLKTIKINYEEDQAVFDLGNIDCDPAPELANFIFCKAPYKIPLHSVVHIKISGVNESNESATTPEALQMIEPSPKLMNDKGLSCGRFCYFNGSLPDVVQLTNFSDSPQWIQERVALGKIFGVEEYSDDSQLITKTTEDLDFKGAINKDLSTSDQQQI